MSLTEFDIRAGEILTTAVCPLNCRYCYIPKSPKMQEIHNKIIEQLKNNSLVDRLWELYGSDLEYLGFWGTEPTLTLPIITEKIPYIMTKFPKIKQFSYSTAGITDPKIIVDFVKKIIEQEPDHLIEIDQQISIDGPAWITDHNRMKGSVKIIMDNFIKLVKMLDELQWHKNVKILIGFKPTIDIENMKMFMDDITKIEEYHAFFREHMKKAKSSIMKCGQHISLNEFSYNPTLVVPGKYTSTDGKTFSEFLNIWHRFGTSAYTGRLQRINTFFNELPKRRTLTCSGGDSNFGLSDNLHMCHRTFYVDEESYVESILAGESSIGEADNWDVSLYNRGIIGWIREKFIVDPKDKKEVIRFLYTLRGHHDFWRFQIGYIRAMLTELVLVGQGDKELIEDEGLFELFAIFLLTGMNCPMENLLNTGSINLIPVSLIRLWANGAFAEVINSCMKRL